MAVPLTLSSVPAQTPYVQYVSSASQTVFPYPFEITQDSDLVCLINGVQQATDSGYTLSGQGTTGGGNLTFTLGQTAGTIITLYRNIPISRITQLSQNGTFFSSNFNNEFNRIYLIMQQLQQSLLPGGTTAFALMVPNSNSPQPTTLLVPSSYANKYLSFDSNGNPTPAQLTTSGSLTQAIIAGLLTPPTPAEITAGITVVQEWFLPGNINRYGANATPGTTDMSTALTSALACNQCVYIPAGTYAFAQSGAFSMLAGQTLYGDGPASIMQFAYNGGDNIEMSNVVGAVVRDLAMTSASGGSQIYNGVVAIIDGSTYCKVERVDISGTSGSGITLGTGVSYCTIRDNSFHNFSGTTQDQADIRTTLAGSASYNVIEGNQCFGGGYHGIILQTTSGSPNAYNIISGNRVGQHTCYGIANYSSAATVDNFNQIIGNFITGILGTGLSGAGGAGIYVVGSGGDVIANNIVTNCCIDTTATTLAPAAIGIAVSSATTPVTISGNTISGMTKYFGIYVTSSSVGANIIGNTIQHPANTTGGAIATNNSSGVNISGNTIISVSAQDAIQIFGTANEKNIAINGNNISTAGYPIRMLVAVATTFTGVSISGNQLVSSGASNGISVEYLINATISGNTINVAAASALAINTCLTTTVTGNMLQCAAAQYALTTAGTCTGSIADSSNYYSATGGPSTGAVAIDNGATGFTCHSNLSGSPGAGVAAIGDISFDLSGVKALYVYSSGSAWAAVAHA